MTKIIVAAFVIIGFLVIGALYSMSFMAKRPTDLGVKNGRLAECPETPNCVCSYASDATHAIEPIAYVGDRESARVTLKEALARLPRFTVIEEEANYLRAEATSALFRFVDDVEFLFDDEESVIHVRSASRVGRSDLGANRRRVEQIRSEFLRARGSGEI